MKKASISEAKNRLSALISSLTAGKPVLIMDRGRPVARLESVASGPNVDREARLSRLTRDGIVRPPRAALARSLFAEAPPRLQTGVSAVAALIAERRESR